MKIAFIKSVGLTSGGTERYLQTIATFMAQRGHTIDYFYTNDAPSEGTSWRHPPNDDSRKAYIESFGVNTIPVHVDLLGHSMWHGTDFFLKFDEKKYDLIISARGGYPEYPFTHINNVPIIDTVHGIHVHNQKNIIKSILLCEWQSKKWIQNGGDASRLEIIPSIVYVPPSFNDNFRKELDIPIEAFVYGFHQRNDEGLFSTIPLDAFYHVQDQHFVLLGGCDKYKEYAKEKNIKNVHFLNHTSDTNIIHKFLNTLDCYTHSKPFGEVCSACIIEAMSHGLPLISHPSNIDQGHVEMLEQCGKIANNINEYITEMKLLKDNITYRSKMSFLVKQKYNNKYEFNLIKNKICDAIERGYNEYFK
jgi:glycosyltransferase involved in cell wall biosynthesis